MLVVRVPTLGRNFTTYMSLGAHRAMYMIQSSFYKLTPKTATQQLELDV